MTLGLMFAAACCVGAVAREVFTPTDVRANEAGAAMDAIHTSTNEDVARGAARRLADIGIDVIEALIARSQRQDLVADHCRQYLARIAKLAATAPSPAPPKDGR